MSTASQFHSQPGDAYGLLLETVQRIASVDFALSLCPNDILDARQLAQDALNEIHDMRDPRDGSDQFREALKLILPDAEAAAAFNKKQGFRDIAAERLARINKTKTLLGEST